MFFMRVDPARPSGLETLAAGAELEVCVGKMTAAALPLLRRALQEAQRFRQSRGLEPYPTIGVLIGEAHQGASK